MLLVKWLDAGTNIEHEADLSEAEEVKQFGAEYECTDIGFLVRWNKKVIVLAVSHSMNEEIHEVRHANTIPTDMVLDVDLLCHQTIAKSLPQPSEP